MIPKFRQISVPLRGYHGKVFSASAREAAKDLEAKKYELEEYWRTKYEKGDQTAALRAIETCAWHGLPMPDWLADLVNQAVFIALESGTPDQLLGLGNAKMLAKWKRKRREWRDGYVRKALAAWETISQRPGEFQGITKGGLIEYFARKLHTSTKNIEKIAYTSPTFKNKK